jgi:hypothetical protein
MAWTLRQPPSIQKKATTSRSRAGLAAATVPAPQWKLTGILVAGMLLQLAVIIKAAHSMASHLPNIHVTQAGHCLASQHTCHAIAAHVVSALLVTFCDVA